MPAFTALKALNANRTDLSAKGAFPYQPGATPQVTGVHRTQG
jgi:hypothetical protein